MDHAVLRALGTLTKAVGALAHSMSVERCKIQGLLKSDFSCKIG